MEGCTKGRLGQLAARTRHVGRSDFAEAEPPFMSFGEGGSDLPLYRILLFGHLVWKTVIVAAIRASSFKPRLGAAACKSSVILGREPCATTIAF